MRSRCSSIIAWWLMRCGCSRSCISSTRSEPPAVARRWPGRPLGEVLEKVERSSARALVVTGRGNIFCAGVDLFRALAEGPDYFRSFLPALREALEAIFFFRKPLVAAINGHAAAGGCILACAADRRLM